MKSELGATDLNDVALVKKRVGNSFAIHEGARGGMMIDDLIAALIRLFDRCMQAADREVFEKDIAGTAAPNGHIGEQFYIMNAVVRMNQLEMSGCRCLRFGCLADMEFTTARSWQLEWLRSLADVKSNTGCAEKQLITVVEHLLGNRLPIDETITATMVIAEYVLPIAIENAGLLPVNRDVL